MAAPMTLKSRPGITYYYYYYFMEAFYSNYCFDLFVIEETYI